MKIIEIIHNNHKDFSIHSIILVTSLTYVKFFLSNIKTKKVNKLNNKTRWLIWKLRI